MSQLIKQRQGFSLLEMMITLMVLSIGLLGVAALQSRGQQFTHAAYVRTQAAILGYDIMERIRINKEWAFNDLPTTGLGVAGEGYIALQAPTTVPDCDLNTCNTSQLRDYDIAQWYAQINAKLPVTTANADGTTLTSANTSSITAKARNDPTDLCPRVGYVIFIRWGQREGSEDSSGNSDKSIRMEMCL